MPRKKTNTIQKKKSTKLETEVFNTKGEVIGKISLPEEIFRAKVNSKLMAQAIRVYLANQRLGTHSTKNRAQVSGSTRKIYRQKGTGRARHGSIKAPIFIGGGIAHGPRPRDYSLKLPKKAKKLALFSALTSKYGEGKMKVVTDLEKIDSKTKMMAKILENLSLEKEKKQKASSTLLVLPSAMKNVILAGRNLPSLTIAQARLLNTYDVLVHENILLTPEVILLIKDHFIKKSKVPSSSLQGKTVLFKKLTGEIVKPKKPKRKKGKKV